MHPVHNVHHHHHHHHRSADPHVPPDIHYQQQQQQQQQQPQHPRSPPPPMLHPADSSPSASHPSHPHRTPTKRSRKAINCEPCRASKLKCDRARPCSSCVLRGTTALCYQGDPRMDNADSIRADEASRADPHQEFARIRQSLNLIEAHVMRSPGASWLTNGGAPSTPADHSPRPHQITALKQESFDPSLPQSIDLAPGMLQARTGDGGMYAGPTSAATHLAFLKPEVDDQEDQEDEDHRSVLSDPGPSAQQYSSRDFDLLAMLPEVSIVDGLLAHYFESCQWEHRHLHYHTFTAAWARFKSNVASDRLVLATVFMVLAIAVQFLPPRHPLVDGLPETPAELSENYYNIGCTALQRYHAECRTYSLELIELLLLRTHYLNISKDQCEDLWALRGELVSTATAMGLHRDPSRWKISRDVAERRRWAWWNIMLTERWQAFMFGRPLAIHNHHFDTQFPAGFDSSYDPSGRLHLPHIHLFRLAETLGDVIDDAVSVRPVPYERILAQDKALEHWLQTLPSELDLDDYRLARALSSPVLEHRRTGAQSLCMRTFYCHVRFTLHRPYASPWQPAPSPRTQDTRWQQSQETAINAADTLTQLVTTARPDFLANSALAVPGHLQWGPFHIFSAAMFFTFQLVMHPTQPGASLFRTNVSRIMVVLEHLRGIAIADKALEVLRALAPLYDEQRQQPAPAAERARVLSAVRRLAFPCHDSPGISRRLHVNPHPHGSVSPQQQSPADSISPPAAPGTVTPAVPAAALPQQQQHSQQQQPPYAQQQSRHVFDGPYAHAEEPVWGPAISVDSADWAHFIGAVRPGARPDGLPSSSPTAPPQPP